MAKGKVALTPEVVAEVEKAFGSLQKKEVLTVESVIDRLYEQIKDAMENKGYSIPEILDVLKQNGIELKESSFKIYWRKAKRERSTT